MTGKAVFFLLLAFLTCRAENTFCQDSKVESQPDSRQRAETSLIALPSRVRDIDEAALRILVRIEAARFLWQSGQTEHNSKAEEIITEAAADLETHRKEMPDWYVKIFRRDILALLHIHSPALLERLKEQKTLDPPAAGSSYELTFALLDANEPGKAAETMKRAIGNGGDLDFTSLTALSRFALASVSDLSRLLEAVLDIAESRPDAYSLNTLAQLNSYFRGSIIINGIRPAEKVPDSLKARWIRFVVRRISILHTANAWRGSSDTRFAYGLLTSLTQDIERLEPFLLPLVMSLLPAIRDYVSKDTADNIESRAKLDQSEDSVGERLKKANAAEDKNDKVRLYKTAAQAAAADGNLQQAFDVASEINCKDKDEALWCDQFYEQLANLAIRKKDMALTEKSVARLSSPKSKASALQKMASLLFEAGDQVRARQTLGLAITKADEVESNTDRSMIFLGLMRASLKVDKARAVEIFQLASKAINRLPSPKFDDDLNSNEKHRQIVELLWVARAVIPVFKEMGREDDLGAHSLLQDIKQRGIREAAEFGVCLGLLSEDSVKGNRKQGN